MTDILFETIRNVRLRFTTALYKTPSFFQLATRHATISAKILTPSKKDYFINLEIDKGCSNNTAASLVTRPVAQNA